MPAKATSLLARGSDRSASHAMIGGFSHAKPADDLPDRHAGGFARFKHSAAERGVLIVIEKILYALA